MKMNRSWLYYCALAWAFCFPEPNVFAQRVNPPFPAGLEVTSDIVYGNAGGRILRLDTIKPSAVSATPRPAILYIPGGGWSGGNRAGGLARAAFLAERGYFCASMEHRGANEAILPAQIEDAKCAVRFLRSKAAEYNLDPNRIGVWGNSTGGHLASMLGTSADVPGLEGTGSHGSFSSRVQAVTNWFGPSDLVLMLETPEANGFDEVMRVVGGVLPAVRDLAARGSAVTYITKDDPPFLIMHGERDPVVPINQSQLFQQKLVAGGIDSQLFVVPNAGHGFQGAEYDRMVGDFFDQKLKAGAILQPSASSRIVNLSIRTNAGAGPEALIVGFAIGGAGTSGTQALLIRGIGPSLGQFGVSGALVDPQLQLFTASNSVATNDDWGGAASLNAAFAQVGAFPLSSSSKDAAMTATLSSSTYSAQVSGAGVTSGVALAEIYDLTASANASTLRLVNVSARTRIAVGDTLIAGFVIGGSGPKTVIIRAVGPSLGQFGVSDLLADPRLQLFQGSTVIGSNDDWGGASALSAGFTAVGAFALPGTSKDAALQVSLQPGSYSAQVSGVATTSGVALVELYEVP